MSSFDDQINNIRSFIEDVRVNRANEALTIANDMNALLKRRVINRGEDASGSQYSDYSDTKLPSYFFKSVYPNSDDKVDQAKEKYKNGISYREWREFIGRPTDHKNFSLSGRMWDNTKPRLEGQDSQKVVVSIRPSQNEEVDKLRWNEEKFGPIVKLNAKEEGLLKKVIQKRLTKKLQKYNLQ